MRIVRASVGISLCLALAGCTSGQLKPAVLAFAETTAEAQIALNAQVSSLSEAFESESARWAISSPGRIEVQSGDCVGLTGRCRLVVRTPHGDVAPFSLSSGYTTAMMKGFADYSANLKGILDASDPVALSKATDGAKASIIAFGATVENTAKAFGRDASGLSAAVTAAAGPLTEIAVVALKRYTDAKKVEAIKAAVLIMDPALDEAVAVFERVATDARRIQILAAQDKFIAADGVYFRSAPTSKIVRDYRDAAVVYDTALQTETSEIFAKLRTAHHRLALAAQGGNLALRDLWPILADLSSDAAKAATAASHLRSVKDGS